MQSPQKEMGNPLPPSQCPEEELLLDFPGLWPTGEAANTDSFCTGKDLGGASGSRCGQDKGNFTSLLDLGY